MFLALDSSFLTGATDNIMAEAFDSEDEDASAHELTELELQQIYDNIMGAPAGPKLLLHTSRVAACHHPFVRPTPRARRLSNTNTNNWYRQFEQSTPHVFQFFSVGYDRALDPWRAFEERRPSIMAWLFSLINKIWMTVTTCIVGVVFVLPLFTLACITTTAATVFLFILIIAKCISDGSHRLTQWWFSGDDSRLEWVPVSRARNNTVAQNNGVRLSRHGSGAGSQSSNGTPSRSNRSNSDASLSSMPNPNRDYEGVGGWKTDLNETDQAIFMNMNSNSGLELGSPSRRRRSFGASSVISSGFNSPELINTPLYGRSNASGSLRRMSGTGSPQSYFSVPIGGSMVNINSRRSSRVLLNNERVRVEKENGSDATEDETAVA